MHHERTPRKLWDEGATGSASACMEYTSSQTSIKQAKTPYWNGEPKNTGRASATPKWCIQRNSGLTGEASAGLYLCFVNINVRFNLTDE